ncbi:hypothetical protein BX600DRAFT_514934 [Xylariales sp. PMI_506]|nr:hypothetical protein BX600DRAFT_514934 [Xylariales sp. PMI_506]
MCSSPTEGAGPAVLVWKNVTTDAGVGLAGLLGGNTCICAANLTLDAVHVVDTRCATPCAGVEASTNTQCGGETAVEVLVYSTVVDDGVPGSVPQEVADYGCYADESGNNIGSADVLALSWMTRDMCRANCLLQYGYYAVGNGTTCYCGGGLGSGTVKAASVDLCGTPCGGDTTVTCGGDGYLNLFGTSSTAP